MKREKKICIIAKYIHPNDTRLTQQVNALTGAGYKVDIFCLKYKNQPAREQLGPVTVYRLMEKKHKENFLTYLVSTLQFMSLCFFHLLILALKNNYRIIVSHTLPEFLVLIAAGHKCIGKKIILDARDLTVELLSSRWNSKTINLIKPVACFVEKLCTRLSGHIITASPGFKRCLVKRQVPENKISVMINTADQDVFRYNPGREFKKITAGGRFIYHGTVSSRFGVLKAVEAMPLVLKEIPGSVFYIYGAYDPQYKALILETIGKLKLETAVRVGGYFRLEELNTIISGMDIGIVPYLSDYFMNIALSTKTFEYIAAGLPVVSSRLDSIEELFGDDSIHYTVPGNPAGIAETVVKLCRDPGLRSRKRETAYRVYCKNHSDVIRKNYTALVRRYF